MFLCFVEMLITLLCN